MKKFLVILYRAIIMGFSTFFITIKNPEIAQKSYFKVAATILDQMLKVSAERRPMMAKIAVVHPDIATSDEIITVWVGVGAASSPTDRISELIKENTELKEQLAEAISG